MAWYNPSSWGWGGGYSGSSSFFSPSYSAPSPSYSAPAASKTPLWGGSSSFNTPARTSAQITNLNVSAGGGSVYTGGTSGWQPSTGQGWSPSNVAGIPTPSQVKAPTFNKVYSGGKSATGSQEKMLANLNVGGSTGLTGGQKILKSGAQKLAGSVASGFGPVASVGASLITGMGVKDYFQGENLQSLVEAGFGDLPFVKEATEKRSADKSASQYDFRSTPSLSSSGFKATYGYAGTESAKTSSNVISGNWNRDYDLSTIKGQYQKEWDTQMEYYTKNPSKRPSLANQESRFGQITSKYQKLSDVEVGKQKAAYTLEAETAYKSAVEAETTRATAGVEKGKSDFSKYVSYSVASEIYGDQMKKQRQLRSGQSESLVATQEASQEGLRSTAQSYLKSLSENKYVTMSGSADIISQKTESERQEKSRSVKPKVRGATGGVLSRRTGYSSSYSSLLGG